MSFRGAAAGCEPGTHEHRSLEYGFRACRFAASRNDDEVCETGEADRVRMFLTRCCFGLPLALMLALAACAPSPPSAGPAAALPHHSPVPPSPRSPYPRLSPHAPAH